MQFERRGRRLGAPYPLPLRGRWLLPQAKDGGREMKKSLPQSNAAHLTALPSRGTRFCLRLGAPNKIDRFAHKCSLFPPPAAVTFVARQRGRKRREQAPALPYYNRYFPEQGNHPALPCKLYFVRVGNGLDRSANLPTCWGGGARKARDGGANHIKIRGRTQFAPTSREQPKTRSAKSHQN